MKLKVQFLGKTEGNNLYSFRVPQGYGISEEEITCSASPWVEKFLEGKEGQMVELCFDAEKKTALSEMPELERMASIAPTPPLSVVVPHVNGNVTCPCGRGFSFEWTEKSS